MNASLFFKKMDPSTDRTLKEYFLFLVKHGVWYPKTGISVLSDFSTLCVVVKNDISIPLRSFFTHICKKRINHFFFLTWQVLGVLNGLCEYLRLSQVRLFLRARAVIKFVLAGASTSENIGWRATNTSKIQSTGRNCFVKTRLFFTETVSISKLNLMKLISQTAMFLL